jgi:hypothetical protein
VLYVGPDGLLEGDEAPGRATLVLECTSATAEELWSGGTSFPAAITQGRLRIRGRVARVLAVMPTLAIAVAAYPDLTATAEPAGGHQVGLSRGATSAAVTR